MNKNKNYVNVDPINRKEIYELLLQNITTILELITRLTANVNVEHFNTGNNQELKDFLDEVDLSYNQHYHEKIKQKLIEKENILKNLWYELEKRN